MSALILLNMFVFVISTDDSINDQYSGLFYIVEGVTSVLFLIDYVCRVIVITEHKHFSDPVWGRYATSDEITVTVGRFRVLSDQTQKLNKTTFLLDRINYLLTPIAVVDAISTFPFFLEIIFSTNLPLTTPLRLFRLTRIPYHLDVTLLFSTETQGPPGVREHSRNHLPFCSHAYWSGRARR
mmetsp:Transcript_37138/g.148164  ORF Transcript_37138/g.148164 Transcript_37138/m.148164 type:complete len:182 (+) Transcript_37138:458-1003(+)